MLGRGRRGAVNCPAKTIVGKATAVSPLLPHPLSGNVYLVQGIRTNAKGQQIKTLPSLLIPLKGDVQLNLHAKTSVDGAGRLISTFSGIPDAAVSNFKLTINGGRKGILVVTGRGQQHLQSGSERHGQAGSAFRRSREPGDEVRHTRLWVKEDQEVAQAGQDQARLTPGTRDGAPAGPARVSHRALGSADRAV